MAKKITMKNLKKEIRKYGISNTAEAALVDLIMTGEESTKIKAATLLTLLYIFRNDSPDAAKSSINNILLKSIKEGVE